jgi:hypothetical protein
MKARIAFIALALASSQASAEWELVGESGDGSKFFMDFSTGRQQGKYMLVWGRVDLPKAEVFQGKIHNSLKVLRVFDCEEYRFASKSAAYYSGKSGTGEIVYSFSAEMYEVEFSDVVPGTVVEDNLNRACGKRK